MPTLTPEERARIKSATGKEAEDLDVHNAQDNLIMGSLHLAHSPGATLVDKERFYVAGSNNAGSPQADKYVANVGHFSAELASGDKLTQDAG